MIRSRIKSTAREAFTAQRNPLMLATLVVVAMSLGWGIFSQAVFGSNYTSAGMSLAEFALSVVQVIIFGVLSIGLSKMSWDALENRPINVGGLFEYFKKFGDAAALIFLITVKTFLWSLLFIIPGIIAGYRYSQAIYIWIENPELSAAEAIAKSCEMMRGYKMNRFVFDISFFLWSLLVVVTLGIAYIWVGPYINTAYVEYYRALKREIYGDESGDYAGGAEPVSTAVPVVRVTETDTPVSRIELGEQLLEESFDQQGAEPGNDPTEK